MSLIGKLYDWLSQGPAPDCDRIIEAALEHAEPAWAERLHRLLHKRGHESSLAVLIGQYDALADDIREAVTADPQRFEQALPRALKSPSQSARVGALRAAAAAPSVRTVYLVSDSLRDPDSSVRALAGKLLHKIADDFLDRKVTASDTQAVAKYRADRRQLVQALAEGLRTFDLHERGEVLEACLWFARDLGDDLWKSLTSPRSRAGMIADERFDSWNDPRLAGFLLAALCQPAWTAAAAKLLESWESAPEAAAILCGSRELEQEEFRRRLRSIRNPKWFSQLDEELSDIPPNLRAHAPRWVVELGFTDLEKVALLSRWVWASDQNVHRNAVYALAKITNREATRILKEVADSSSPLAEYARWCVRSQDGQSKPKPSAGPEAARPWQPPAKTAPPENPFGVDFTLLWKSCRGTEPAARDGLIELLRIAARAWHDQLRAKIGSSDPRDRVLVLQAVSTHVLAPLFRRDLERLADDPVAAIRKLTRTLLETVPESETATPPASAVRHENLTRDPENAARHKQLRALFVQLADGSIDARDADRLTEVKRLLELVYAAPGPNGAASGTAAEANR